MIAHKHSAHIRWRQISNRNTNCNENMKCLTYIHSVRSPFRRLQSNICSNIWSVAVGRHISLLLLQLNYRKSCVQQKFIGFDRFIAARIENSYCVMQLAPRSAKNGIQENNDNLCQFNEMAREAWLILFLLLMCWAHNRRVYEPKMPPMSKCDHLISVATNCVRPLILLLYSAKKICKYMRIMNEKKNREVFIHAKSPAYNNSIYLWHCASMEISEWNKIFIGRTRARTPVNLLQWHDHQRRP